MLSEQLQTGFPIDSGTGKIGHCSPCAEPIVYYQREQQADNGAQNDT